MKHKQPKRIGVRLLLKWWVALGFGALSCGIFAQTTPQDGLITLKDFQAVRKMFSSEKCDIRNFLAQSEVLGFRPTWQLFDDAPGEPEGQLTDLGSDSLCLIAMSSSFQAYRNNRANKEGVVYPVEIGPKNVFPKRAHVNELVFFLPKSLAPKSCALPEGATLPYTISVGKKDGKLVRRIDALDVPEDCFIAVLKKKNLIPAQ